MTMIKNGDDDIADCIREASTPNPPVGRSSSVSGDHIFNQKALQTYVLRCTQDAEDGGLKDKPGKPRDFYHRLDRFIISLSNIVWRIMSFSILGTVVVMH